MARLKDLKGQAQAQEIDVELRNLAVASILSEVPAIDLLEFYDFVGNSDSIDTGTNVGNPGFRNVNDAITGSVTTVNTPVTVGRKILSDIAKTDGALIDRYGSAGFAQAANLHLQSVEDKARTFARSFMDSLINSDTTVSGFEKGFNGLKKILTGESLYTFLSADGGVVEFGNTDAKIKSQKSLWMLVDKIIQRTRCNLVLAHPDVIHTLKHIGGDKVRVQSANDAFGKMQELTNISLATILDPGFKADNTTRIISLAETCGTSTDATSIYFLRTGEKRDYTIGTTEVGFKVKTTQEPQFTQTSMELQYEPAIVHARSVARLQGIRLA